MARPAALHTCIPDREGDVARSLPGAWTHATLGPDAATADLLSAHADARVLSVLIHDHLTPEHVAALPHLRAVIARSDGYDHLPLDALRERGIGVYHLEGYATESVAQLAIAMLVSLLRRVPEAHAQTAAGTWDRSGLVGRHLGEVTVGLWGTGRIGGRVAAILSHLGATVVAHDLRPDPAVATLPGIRYVDTLDDLLAAADALSLHVPLDDTTRSRLGASALDRLPGGAVLVNIARGGLLDTPAVAAALRSGHLSGFAADVLPGEPRPDLSPLAGLPNVLLTPHLGAHNHETIARRYRMTAELTATLLRGQEPDPRLRVA